MDDSLNQNWDFLAPQFVDFSKPVDDSFEDGDNPEEYFNFDHENNIPVDIGLDETPSSTVETQSSLSVNETQDTAAEVEEAKPSSSEEETTCNQEECLKESVGIGLEVMKISAPTFHFTSDSKGETETEDDLPSVPVHSTAPMSPVLSDNDMTSVPEHSAAPPPPVFSEDDVPPPPKTTEVVDEETENAMPENDSPMMAVDEQTEKAKPENGSPKMTVTRDEHTLPLKAVAEDGLQPSDSSDKNDGPISNDAVTVVVTTENRDRIVTSSISEDSLEGSYHEEAEQKNVDATALIEAPVISLPVFSQTVVMEDDDKKMKEYSPPSTIVPSVAVKPYIPVNLVTSWTSSSSDAESSKIKPVNQIKKPLHKRRGSESQAESRITRSMTRPRRSLRVKPRQSNQTDSNLRASKRRRTDLTITTNHKNTSIPKLTMPQTPTFLRRKKHFFTDKQKKTEELEMQRIEELQKQAANTRKMAEESYKRLQCSTKYVPVRSQKPATQPKEFEFQTNTRVTRSVVPNSECDDKDFFSSLRKHAEPQKKAKGPTIPQPFNFSASQHKPGYAEDAGSSHQAYKSMAEQVIAFQVKTPERFQTWKRAQQNKGPVMQSILPTKLTCPKTPALETRKRKRPNTAVSAKDKEDKEVEDMKSYKFKANPVNPRVMSNFNIGIKVPVHKEPTKAIGFAFHSTRREREVDHTKEEEEERVEFHAKPVPAKILQGVTGLPDAKKLPLTCAKSPAFALKNRKRTFDFDIKPEEEEIPQPIKARPVPHSGVPFIPNLAHKTTEIAPFSFAERDEAIALKKEEKKQQLFKEEQKLREFKAQLMPIFDNVSGLPEKKAKKTTTLKPFGLSHEDVGAKRAEEWSKKMAEELEAERHQTFHAREANVLYKKPFVPQKSDKPLTEINDFALNSDKRAEQRQQYEDQKRMREHELNLHKAEIERQDAIKEQKEIEQMRAAMVHKSNPIRHYKAVEVEHSDKKLTKPKTPNFSDRFKNRTVL
ncbi:targeting protein for Xklp2-A-like [Antedon mediterranea]|uniref:targeting protein for Xklp2-A-like n=1 Tax=Antedon mediterranea TaxID=105859 RepID=UPI003AF73FCD